MKEAVLLLLQDLTLLANQLAAANGERCHFSFAVTFVDCLPALTLGASSSSHASGPWPSRCPARGSQSSCGFPESSWQKARAETPKAAHSARAGRGASAAAFSEIRKSRGGGLPSG